MVLVLGLVLVRGEGNQDISTSSSTNQPAATGPSRSAIQSKSKSKPPENQAEEDYSNAEPVNLHEAVSAMISLTLASARRASAKSGGVSLPGRLRNSAKNLGPRITPPPLLNSLAAF